MPGIGHIRYFYPRSPCGERLNSRFLLGLLVYFYPRSPCGERPGGPRPPAPPSHFYPRSPCGERLFPGRLGYLSLPFLSTLSLRRATGFPGALRTTENYFYPRSPCGERPGILLDLALHKNFYPRSPCGERPAIDK